MKFAIELDTELVPEWRTKYFDYNQGKKKITAFSRALRIVNSSSNVPGPTKRGSYFPSLHNTNLDRIRNEAPTDGSANTSRNGSRLSKPVAISRRMVNNPEQQPLRDDFSDENNTIQSRYGSIVGSPTDPPDWGKPKQAAVRFEVPDLAPRSPSQHGFKHKPSPLANTGDGSISEMGESRLLPSRGIKRLMSLGGSMIPGSNNLPVEAYRELDARQADFFDFLDSELEKIESFYKFKEQQATDRLKVIRDQLHVMRDCHIDELVKAKTESIRASGEDEADGKSMGRSWLDAMDSALETARHASFGKSTKGMEDLQRLHASRKIGENRDYVRRSTAHEVPYRTAKSKLKAAMQEFYRGLELLKAYALLNRKAFRKMNKKFDKAAGLPPTLQYMTDKVNEAYFVKSHVLGGHIRAVEDLYARYFEGGNYKVATSKLRATTDRPNDYNGVVFRNGLMAGTGLWFGIAGLSSAYQLIYHPNPTLALNTNYLLQIYGGYFLMLLLMLLFCLDCKLWSLRKVNYVFVFEFDTRHHLDWRELAELPCICLLLLGVFLWFNFSTLGEDNLFLFYPAILIGLTSITIFLPAPTLFYRSRKWFLYSNWRLFFSGLYPVEFRDFFMGDMFCSLTYSIGNIELFFCLYGHDWSNPDSCSSSHSRILGFLSTLPGIWRTLQCLRRYSDTGNKFPHLANCLKYLCTVACYVSLSVYRMNKTNELFAIFIALATVNSLYCSMWDLVMDWSLLDPFAARKFLRDYLAFKHVWPYYAAMIIDPILRFNWIFYAIFTNDTKHSAIISFLVATSEIIRRGIWVIFRVENEHCTNIGLVRASRDLALPYHIEHHSPEDHVEQENGHRHSYTVRPAAHDEDPTHVEHRRQGVVAPLLTRMSSYTSGVFHIHHDHVSPPESATVTRRKKRLEANPLLRRVGSILHTAHAQDFERKKKPGDVSQHSKDEEEEEVMDVHGNKVDDAKLEVARRVAEAVAEQAAKAAEEAEDDEEALNELAWGPGSGAVGGSGEQIGESSTEREVEDRIRWRFRKLDQEGEGDEISVGSRAESPGGHAGGAT